MSCLVRDLKIIIKLISKKKKMNNSKKGIYLRNERFKVSNNEIVKLFRNNSPKTIATIKETANEMYKDMIL